MKKPVRLGVERHVASAKFRLNVLYHAEFAGSVFMEDVESAFASGGKEQTCFGLVNICVHAIADRKTSGEPSRCQHS